MTDNKIKHKKQHGPLVAVYRSLLIIAPAILVLITGLFALKNYGVFAPGIKWNDEAVYLKLVETYATDFAPVGYYGFDLNHAAFGTGSAWSPAIIWPYAFLYRLFASNGSAFSFVYIINIIYITVANGLFVLLTAPKRHQALRIAIAELTSAVLILYLTTNMSEVFRFAIGIVIAGILYRMAYMKSGKIFKYVLAPLFIIYACQVYTFFAFAIPLYVFALKREYKKQKDYMIQALVALGATLVVGGGSYVLLHFISSNYNIAKTEGLLDNLSKGQVLDGLKSLAWMVKDGLSGMYRLLFTYKTNPIYLCHMITAIAIVLVGIVVGIRNKKNDRFVGLISAAALVIFFGAYATLYTIVPDTFMRGTEIVIIFCLYLLCMAESRMLVNGLLVVNAFGMLALPQNMDNFIKEERYMDAATVKEWTSMSARFETVIVKIDSDDPWDNTVAMYTMEPEVISAIPSGMGINFALNGYEYSDKPGYLVFTRHSSDSLRADWVETDYNAIRQDVESNILRCYTNVYEDDEYVIYRHTDTIGR